MSTVFVGARDQGQQLASFKWSLSLPGGRWLYFGAPAAVISEDAGRAELLRNIGGATAVASIAAAAAALQPPPARLKVYYRTFATGDAHPAPELPAVQDAGGGSRDPTDPEKAFALLCARQLPSYDVTMRASRRMADLSIPLLPARPFSRPLPSAFTDAPFSSTIVGVTRRDAELYRMGITDELKKR